MAKARSQTLLEIVSIIDQYCTVHHAVNLLKEHRHARLYANKSNERADCLVVLHGRVSVSVKGHEAANPTSRTQQTLRMQIRPSIGQLPLTDTTTKLSGNYLNEINFYSWLEWAM